MPPVWSQPRSRRARALLVCPARLSTLMTRFLIGARSRGARVPVPVAAGLLQALYQARLLIGTKATWGRYGMHDLIRTYIQDRAATMPAEDREQALNRLLDYYQHTATRAEARQTRPGSPVPCQNWHTGPELVFPVIVRLLSGTR